MSDTDDNAIELTADMIELAAFGPGGTKTWWIGPDLPEPFDLNEAERSENRCQCGPECADNYNGRGAALIGWHLTEIKDTYDSGREEMAWHTGWLIDGRWVLCEDCANAEEEGDLTITDDGKFVWTDEEEDR